MDQAVVAGEIEVRTVGWRAHHGTARYGLERSMKRGSLAAMTRQKVLDLYFMDARCKLIELAAFLDRVDRAEGDADFRLDAFRQALRHLGDGDSGRAEAVLRSLSDPTEAPIAQAPGKGAVGAWPGK